MSLPASLSDLYRHIKRELHAAGVPTADQDARLMIEHHTAYGWADIIARGDDAAEESELKRIAADMQRRIAGEPLSRIYGERQFWGLNFKICKDTLDPRPDTETLVEAVLNHYKDKAPGHILDLGTGSGCILIALLSEYKGAQGVGIDKSLNALKTARENAQANHVGDRVLFYCGSWGQALDMKFDVIVSNPPYISNQVIPALSKTVRNHDPILALDGGEDGLDAYKSILMEIKKHLAPGGAVFFEIGFDQADDVVRLVEDSGLSVQGLHRDLAGQPRVVEAS